MADNEFSDHGQLWGCNMFHNGPYFLFRLIHTQIYTYILIHEHNSMMPSPS
jgi:hypothetical protein